jgi:hypothetical protein
MVIIIAPQAKSILAVIEVAILAKLFCQLSTVANLLFSFILRAVKASLKGYA